VSHPTATGSAITVDTTLSLSLPRDKLSIPVARRMCAAMMRVLGVDGVVVDDLQVAVTEACTNVVKHAEDGADYAVTVRLLPSSCEIDVIDRGGGFFAGELGHADAEAGAEHGRGIQLMRALVDQVHFQVQEGSNVVRLTKRLRFSPESAGERLLAGVPEQTGAS
jgi:serine/threonine-protein kinase RsbW